MNYTNYITINTNNLTSNIKYIKDNYKYTYYIFNISNNAFFHGLSLINYLDSKTDYLYTTTLLDIPLIRKINYDIPLIYSGPFNEDHLLDFLNHHVILTLTNFKDLNTLANYDLFAPLNIILNVDLNGYFGFQNYEEINEALNILKNNPKINVYGLKAFNLTSKEYPNFLKIINHPSLTNLTLYLFNNEDDKNKIKNSNAILLDSSFYGLTNSKPKLFQKNTNPLFQICTIYSKIINIKETKKGNKTQYIATIPLGFNHGFNEPKVLINNELFTCLEVFSEYSLILVNANVSLNSPVIITSHLNPFLTSNLLVLANYHLPLSNDELNFINT